VNINSIFSRFIINLILILLFLSIELYAQEGKKYELTKIFFYGNNIFSDGELENVVSSKETPNWFSQFINEYIGFGEAATYLNLGDLQNDAALINDLYFNSGYFTTKVTFQYLLDSENSSAELHFNINEGRPTFYNSLTVLGLEDILPEFKNDIDEMARFDAKQIYSTQFLENMNASVLDYLRNRGMMLANSESPVIEIDTITDKVDIVLKYNSGKRYIISGIEIEKGGAGRDLISDELLRKLVDIDTGSYYNYSKIKSGQTRLYRTNLFSSASVNGVIADTVQDRVPINIAVNVSYLHEISPEIIANNEDQSFNLGLGLGFIKRNFFGDARKFTISTSAALKNFIESKSTDSTIMSYADARIIIDQPFLFGAPINTKLENYFTIQKRQQEYNTDLFGSKLSLDFELPEKVYISSLTTYFYWENLEVTYEQSYLSTLAAQFLKRKFPKLTSAQLDSSVAAVVSGIKNVQTTNTAVIGVHTSSVQTNNFLFPTEGYTLSLLLEDGNTLPYLISLASGNQYSEPRYYKFLVKSSLYFPMYNSNTSAFGMKFNIGNIHVYEGNKARVPLNQRFYAGGSNSIRGWRSRELTPDEEANSFDLVSPQDLEAILVDDFTPGGFFLVEGSVETRNRIIGNLGGAVFLDFGNSWLSYRDFTFKGVAIAAGLGLRYYSEIVPFRLDFGTKAYDPNDSRNYFKKLNDPGGFWKNFQFQIGIGEAF